jgi:hypothetical protein
LSTDNFKNSEKFIWRYKKHLSENDKAKMLNYIEKDELFSDEVTKKISELDSSNIADCKQATKLAEFTYKSKINVFNKIDNLLKSSIDNSVSDGTVSLVEKDIFIILLGAKTKINKEFFDRKEKIFSDIKEKLDACSDNTSVSGSSTVLNEVKNSSNKEFSEMVSEVKSSLPMGDPSDMLDFKVPLWNDISEILLYLMTFFT